VSALPAAGGSAVVRDEATSSRLFRELDRNRDGRISRSEFEALGRR